MRESDLAYANGHNVLGRGFVAVAAVQRAAGLAQESGEGYLFSRDQLEQDGWRLAASRRSWTVPGRDEGVAPERPGSSPEDVAEQRAAAARLTDDELRARLAEAEAWERWQTDPGELKWRWDRRALYLGRAGRGAGL